MSYGSTFLEPAAPAPPSGAVPDERATEFTALTGVDGTTEVYSGSKLLVGAYVAIWVVLMVWILLLWRKQASLAERLDGLERTIDRAAAAAEKAEKKAKAAKAS
jgi:CcmD family protein